MHTRRDILQLLGASAGAGLLAAALPAIAAAPATGASSVASGFVSKRPPKAQRRFVSKAVEQQIAQIKARIADPELAWLFENCYPNKIGRAHV